MSVTVDAAIPRTDQEPATDDPAIPWRWGLLWRDIARGGFAGLLVGPLVIGLGGRIAMRIAALLVPVANGAETENGNTIGEITLGGSLGLIVFAGLLFGSVVGAIWVVVRPWLPTDALARALLAAIILVALGSPALIQGDNVDFIVLRRDPFVMAVLIGFVGLVGVSMSVVDGWLDRRLPAAVARGTTPTQVYASISLVGVVLILPIAVLGFLGGEMQLAGIGLVVVGLATVTWWVLRHRGQDVPPAPLVLFARLALTATVVAGLAVGLPHVRQALGA